jgi:hypothetical protein
MHTKNYASMAGRRRTSRRVAAHGLRQGRKQPSLGGNYDEFGAGPGSRHGHGDGPGRLQLGRLRRREQRHDEDHLLQRLRQLDRAGGRPRCRLPVGLSLLGQAVYYVWYEIQMPAPPVIGTGPVYN